MAEISQLQLAIVERLKAADRRPMLSSYQPHPKQAEFHGATAQGRVFIGGNRSGKTVAGAVELVRAATGTDPYRKFPEPPLRLRSVSVDLKQGIEKIVVPELAKWVPPSQLVRGSWEDSWSKTNNTLTLANKSFIECLTYEQETEKHAGTSRHAIWFDEEAPEHIFNENMGRLIDTNGCWWMTLTPVEGIEWIYQLYNDVVVEQLDRNCYFVQVDSYDNPHISAAAIDALFGNLSAEQRLARTRGMFEQLGGKIYPNFSDENVVTLSDSFTIPTDWMKVEWMDHGYNNPTCWLFAAISPDGEILVYDEIYERKHTVEQMARLVGERERRYGVPLYRVGDPSIRAEDARTGTSIQFEYAKLGLFIALGNNDVRAGINKVAQLIGNSGERRQLLISDQCTNLLSEIKKYRWAKYATKKLESTRNAKEEPVKKDDHACDTLRYGVTAWLEWGTNPPEEATQLFLGPKALPETITAQEWRSERTEYESLLGDEW